MRVLDLLQKVDWEGLFLVADPSASIDSGEVRGIADEGGDNGAGSSPGIVSFLIRGIRDMDGIEERVCGVVGDETSQGDRVLVLGCFIDS